MKNIYYIKDRSKQGGRYYIRKQIKGVYHYYGSFCELEDAKQKRDELIQNNWKTEPLTKHKNEKRGNTPEKRIAKMFNIKPEDIV